MFADRVLLAVWRLGRTGELSSADRSLLGRAASFLRDASSLKDLAFAERSSDTWPTAVKDMERVMDALPLPVGSSQEFTDYMTKLSQAIETMVADAEPPEDDLGLVERFFSKYSELHHQRSRALTEL